MRAVIAAAALLVAGCDYEAPLVTEAMIPIDPALLGIWEPVAEPGEEPPAADDVVVILRLSPTEYLVHEQGGHFYRGCLTDVAGHRCFQLEDLGTGLEANGANGANGRYLLGRCTLAGDTLAVEFLNDVHVPPRTLRTGAEIRAAILAHRDAPGLFEPVIRLRRRLLPALALPAPEPHVPAENDRVEVAALAPGGRLLVAGLRSGHVAAIDLVAGRLAWTAAAHEGPVRCLALGATDRWLLTAGDDLRATLRRGDNGREFTSFEAVPLRAVYEIALSSDARYAATRGFDGFGRVWDLRLDREVCPLFAYGIAFGPRGRFLVSTFGRDPGAEVHRIWPRATADAPLRILPEELVQGVAVDASGTHLAATGGTRDGRAVVWFVSPDDGRTLGEVVVAAPAESTEPAAALVPTFSADGRWLAVAVSDGRVVRIDVAARSVADTWQLPAGGRPRRVGFVAGDVWVTSLDDVPGDTAAGTALPVTTRLLRAGVADPVWTLGGEATMADEQPVGAAVLPEGDLVLFERAGGRPAWRLRPSAHGTRWDVQRAR